MTEIQPDRTNWRRFCQEDELTTEETAAWNAMAKAIREAEARGDGELFDFIMNATDREFGDFLRIERAARADDWSDLVAWADASRRLKRAKIAAWERWKMHLPEREVSPPLGAPGTLTDKATGNNDRVRLGT